MHTFHGTFNYGFNVFDKSKARIEGNSVVRIIVEHRGICVSLRDPPVCAGPFSLLDPLAKEPFAGWFFCTLAPVRVRFPYALQ